MDSCFHGARNIFNIALQSIQDDQTAAVHAMVKSMPALGDASGPLWSSKGEEFAHLLLPVNSSNASDDLKDEADLQDEETKEAYAFTLKYLGHLHQAIKSEEHIQEICRWLIFFAVMLPPRIICLIELKRPRALAILAYYFALVGFRGGATEKIWWIGRIARREVEGIQKYLPDAWQHLMSWPLAMTNPTPKLDEIANT